MAMTTNRPSGTSRAPSRSKPVLRQLRGCGGVSQPDRRGGTSMAQTTVSGIEGVQGLVGQHLGHSDWVEITQEQVNQFAEATGDHQWIHVDPERAKKESPFGGPIAHGYLTLSLGPRLMPEIMRVEGVTMAVNYGCEKVRFPSPVPVGSKVRLGAELTGVDDI